MTDEFRNQWAMGMYRLIQYYDTPSDVLRARWKRSNAVRFQKAKQFVFDYKSSHPCVCGESDPACLDFHHRDPSGKTQNVLGFVRSGVAGVRREIEKCETICANCHRKGHAGRPRAEHAEFFPSAIQMGLALA
jgi:hypothetical protein